MVEFIGRLHPALVHFPVGILILACAFQLLSTRKSFAFLQPAISTILLWGMFSALFSCITGFMLSRSGEYDETIVVVHQWMGLTTAFTSLLYYFFYKTKQYTQYHSLFSIGLLLIVGLTGHWGGTLTHGEGYLTEPFKQSATDSSGTRVRVPIANVQEAVAYTAVIQPILKDKCYSCHGSTKQKGKLRMDVPDALMKGGKDGAVIDTGNAEKSELIKRIVLAREEEHHMPPKEKAQLTGDEIALIHWWINEGASFDKKVKDLQQPEKIKPVLLSLQKAEIKVTPAAIPTVPVEKANDAAIQKLKSMGVVVMPVGLNSNYLLANYVSVNNFSFNQLELLLPLKKQLIWLKLSDRPVTDSAMNILSQLTMLTKLQLDNTKITDKGLAGLSGMQQLQSVNLVGTKITATGLTQLKGLPKLASIFLYQTNIEKKDWGNLKKQFPKAILDSGGYTVTLLKTDTSLVKPPKINQ